MNTLKGEVGTASDILRSFAQALPCDSSQRVLCVQDYVMRVYLSLVLRSA
jgi:hypothetical protein